MPKVTRTQTSFLSSPTVRFVSALLVFALLSFGVAVYLGYSDKGAIDINKKIAGTNQDGFANKVNQLSGNTAVNGGLKPSTEQIAPPVPPPAVPEPTPVATSTATSSPLHAEATTTVGLKKK